MSLFLIAFTSEKDPFRSKSPYFVHAMRKNQLSFIYRLLTLMKYRALALLVKLKIYKR